MTLNFDDKNEYPTPAEAKQIVAAQRNAKRAARKPKKAATKTPEQIIAEAHQSQQENNLFLKEAHLAANAHRELAERLEAEMAAQNEHTNAQQPVSDVIAKQEELIAEQQQLLQNNRELGKTYLDGKKARAAAESAKSAQEESHLQNTQLPTDSSGIEDLRQQALKGIGNVDRLVLQTNANNTQPPFTPPVEKRTFTSRIKSVASTLWAVLTFPIRAVWNLGSTFIARFRGAPKNDAPSISNENQQQTENIVGSSVVNEDVLNNRVKGLLFSEPVPSNMAHEEERTQKTPNLQNNRPLYS